jgi:hypothetical protein
VEDILAYGVLQNSVALESINEQYLQKIGLPTDLVQLLFNQK